MKYFLHISYDGRNYRGWQQQVDAPSVQEEIETTLKRILKVDTPVYGCGRTDSGVHASQFFLHLFIESPIEYDLKFRLNKNLPSDIVVHDIWEMKGDEHARFDATSRTYDYFFHSFRDPVLDHYSSLYDLKSYDIAAMKKAVRLIGQQTDFKSVCKQSELYTHTRCEVSHMALILDEQQERMRFTITANRFLRGMVRLCVYFLLEIGSGKLSLEEFEHILSDGLIVENMKPALANGLYLSRVEYPYLRVAPRQNICEFLKKGLEC